MQDNCFIDQARVAYRRLCPGSEPGSASRNLTLREACLNAIGRFSPSALQSRSTQSREYGGVPEAAFQDELYCALNYELQNSPVLSEYAHTKGGRIDFFVFDEKWGIEVLQSGDASKIAEHAARFAAGGKYSRWNILKDYIILNFCSKSMVRSIEIEGKNSSVIREDLVLIIHFSNQMFKSSHEFYKLL